MVNEWDFVRYGTISSGERLIAADPPAGLLSHESHANLDRFAITFDAANYIYIDEVAVEVTGGALPAVIATRRRENTEPDTVEIVLDRAIPVGHTTRFTFNDGTIVNTLEYTFATGDANGDNDVDRGDYRAFAACMNGPTPLPRESLPEPSVTRAQGPAIPAEGPFYRHKTAARSEKGSFTGPNACTSFDFNADATIDFRDFFTFQRLFTGGDAPKAARPQRR